jgi:hypothetical protein
LAAGFSMLFSVILLIFANSLIQFKSINFFDSSRVFKTAFISIFDSIKRG